VSESRRREDELARIVPVCMMLRESEVSTLAYMSSSGMNSSTNTCSRQQDVSQVRAYHTVTRYTRHTSNR